jgi:hypothetical protein
LKPLILCLFKPQKQINGWALLVLFFAVTSGAAIRALKKYQFFSYFESFCVSIIDKSLTSTESDADKYL